MPHFFVDSNNINNNKITISDEENYRHIARSLRARAGEKLLLIDEKQIQYETVIENINSKEIVCEIKNSYPSKRDLEFDLYLAQSPLRSDAQLTIMEKATELGIRVVYPVILALDSEGSGAAFRQYRGFVSAYILICKVLPY